MYEIESRDISLIGIHFREDNILISHDNSYLKSIRIFDIQSFNRRIMKSSIIKTRMTQDPLLEDEIFPPNVFLSINRYSSTTVEDLSEAF